MPHSSIKRVRDEGDEEQTKPSTNPHGRKRAKAEPTVEKRKRQFRSKPPQSFHRIYNRAMTQRYAYIVLLFTHWKVY